MLKYLDPAGLVVGQAPSERQVLIREERYEGSPEQNCEHDSQKYEFVVYRKHGGSNSWKSKPAQSVLKKAEKLAGGMN